MKKSLSLLCALLAIAAVMCGCAKRAAEDAADKTNEVVSDIKEDAEEYGKTDDDTNGNLADDGSEVPATAADMDEMIDNGEIEDDHDDAADGDADDSNAETMNGDSDFI